MKTVDAGPCQGYNMTLLQIFGSGPKWTITCGECEGTFKKRLPVMEKPGVQCPYCDTINIIPVTV